MDKNKIRKILKYILFISIPLISVAISNLGNGKMIRDFYLPKMFEGNDELVYVKQVAGTIKYGIPLGYFGYNESHAIIGSYSCWSPALLIGWIFFGSIFGWNSTTLVLINIILLTLSFVAICFILNPDIKQILQIALVYASATWITRFIYSAIPETTCYSLSIILICLVIKAMKDYSKYNIVFQFIIVFLLTIMRPFYLSLIVFPVWILWKNKSKVRWFAPTICTGLFCASYFLVNHFLCAPYQEGKGEVSLTNLKAFSFDSGILKFVYRILQTIVGSFKEMLIYLKHFFEGNGSKGLSLFLLLFIFFLYKAYQSYKEKERDCFFLFVSCVIAYFLMLMAVFLFFSFGAGDKHLIEFVVWGMFVLLLSGTLRIKEFIILEMALIFSYVFCPTQMSNPPKTEIAECREEFQKYEDELQAVMILDQESKTPSYSNTIDWIYADDKDATNWPILFAVPDGFGISFCYREWFLDDATEIQSRYVATVPNQSCARKCEEMGGWLIAEYEGIAIYQLY